MSDKYEYRIVDKDGIGSELEDGRPETYDELGLALADAKFFGSDNPGGAPYSVERRLVGDWEPVEGEKQ